MENNIKIILDYNDIKIILDYNNIKLYIIESITTTHSF